MEIKNTNNSINEISAGIIIFRRVKNVPRFLLLYRGKNHWSFPKGKRDEGEGNFKTALREVYEETGLRPNELRFGERFKAQDRFSFMRERYGGEKGARERVFKTVTYYLAETKNPRVRLPVLAEGERGEPHEGYGWFSYREALHMLRHESLKRNLKKANDLVSGSPKKNKTMPS